MQSRWQKGFGLTEILVAIAMTAIVISSSLYIVVSTMNSRVNSGVAIEMQNARLNIMGDLQDDRGWANTVRDASNANLTCILNSADCWGLGGSFKLRDAANNLVYDATVASAGFSPAGQICATFNRVNGDSQCPIHLDLQWTPLCTASPCLNPQVQITGTFSISTNDQNAMAINLNRLNFTIIRQNSFCGIQQAENLAVVSGSVAIGASNNVLATVASQAYPVGIGQTNVDLLNCQKITMTFQHSVLYQNGAQMLDAQNESDVCFFRSGDDPAAANCVFEWHQLKGNWKLLSNGSTVYSAPASETTNSSAVYQFALNNGEMTFFVNGGRRYVFDLLYNSAMRVSFRPAPLNYSPLGIQNITFQ